MATVTCPHCGEKGKVPEKLLGREGECSKCGEVFTLKKTNTHFGDSDAVAHDSGDEPTQVLVTNGEETFEVSAEDASEAEADGFFPTNDPIEFSCENCGKRLVGSRASLLVAKKCPSCKSPVTAHEDGPQRPTPQEAKASPGSLPSPTVVPEREEAPAVGSEEVHKSVTKDEPALEMAEEAALRRSPPIGLLVGLLKSPIGKMLVAGAVLIIGVIIWQSNFEDPVERSEAFREAERAMRDRRQAILFRSDIKSEPNNNAAERTRRFVILAMDAPIRVSSNADSQTVALAVKGTVFIQNWDDTLSTPSVVAIDMFSNAVRYIDASAVETLDYEVVVPDSIQVRRRLFRDLAETEPKSRSEADRKYPELPQQYRADDPVSVVAWKKRFLKNARYLDILDDRMKLAVMKKFDVQPPAYRSIIGEGIAEGWVEGW